MLAHPVKRWPYGKRSLPTVNAGKGADGERSSPIAKAAIGFGASTAGPVDAGA